MKKLLRTICLLGIITIVITGSIVVMKYSGTSASNDVDTLRGKYDINSPLYYDYAVTTITKIIPTRIFVYGMDIQLDEEIYATHVDKITEDTLYSGWKHNFVVLNDSNGAMDISEDELLLLKELAETKHYNIIYIGTELIKQFEELEFVSEDVTLSKNFVYFGSNIITENETGEVQDLNEICYDEVGVDSLTYCIEEYSDLENGIVIFISDEVEVWGI